MGVKICNDEAVDCSKFKSLKKCKDDACKWNKNTETCKAVATEEAVDEAVDCSKLDKAAKCKGNDACKWNKDTSTCKAVAAEEAVDCSKFTEKDTCKDDAC